MRPLPCGRQLRRASCPSTAWNAIRRYAAFPLMPHGGADNTQKILDVLADYGVKCTFFVVGNWADQYPEQAKAIVDSGCELMNHSNAHDHYNSLTAE